MQRNIRIKETLAILEPYHLEIIDDSYLHASHLQDAMKGETHFTIKISANSLQGKTRLEQHNIINNLLKEEFTSGLHALVIKIL